MNAADDLPRLEIARPEYEARVHALQARLERAGLDGMVIFGPARVAYLTGFFFAATERPIALVVPTAGEVAMLIPRLETEHLALQAPQVARATIYPEYPGGGSGRHPMLFLLELLLDLKLANARLACDVDGYEHRWGYRGPRLSALLEQRVSEHLELVDDARMVKSHAEIALITEACRWGDHAHRLMQDMIRAGASELEVSQAASLQATKDMLAALGTRYAPKSREGKPANAMFIRGANTANPHGLHESGGVRAGDVLVTGAYGVVGGYESELERTMIAGAADARFKQYFDAMLEAQDVAFNALRPGRRCCDVERDVANFITDELKMGDLMRHHTGHAFGLEGHEHPFLDLSDETVIEPNMIFSLEPGLYVPGFAGFRHSDTVLVTEDGCRNLCAYPRDLESLTVELM
jgi:Xaa-Pro aminopeptidase